MTFDRFRKANDVSQAAKAVESCCNDHVPESVKEALRSLLEVVRVNTLRIDALEEAVRTLVRRSAP
jgi:hypothetical protein